MHDIMKTHRLQEADTIQQILITAGKMQLINTMKQRLTMKDEKTANLCSKVIKASLRASLADQSDM